MFSLYMCADVAVLCFVCFYMCFMYEFSTFIVCMCVFYVCCVMKSEMVIEKCLEK